MENAKNITLDVSQPNNIKVFDKETNSNYLNITLVNNGETISLDNAANAVFVVHKDDGTTEAVEGVINSGTIKVSINPDNMEFNKCDIWIIDEDQLVLYNAYFYLYISKAGTVDLSKYATLESFQVLQNYVDNYTVNADYVQAQMNAATQQLQPMLDAKVDTETFNSAIQQAQTVLDNKVDKETYNSDLQEAGATIQQLAAAVSSITLNAYPVGSIYMSVNDVSPATLFGGTWERIEDTFLLASGSAYAAGSTGGEATHTLTINEMPAHKHSVPYTDSSASDASWGYSWQAVKGRNSSSIIGSSGGNKAHNNMPPYLAVYVWQRTA